MSETENTEIIIQELTESGVLRLTLNDNGRRNALSEAMLKRLDEVMRSSASDASVRVIIIAANGPTFCAGHDLKEMTAGRDAAGVNNDRGKAYFTKVMETCSGVMQSIVNSPKPVIAEVAGVATAAGCQLVASCDLAYAADTAKFSTPGVHIGLFCSTPMVALSRNVSNKHAMEMLLTGEMVGSERAAEIGLINQVTDADSLRAFTMEIAEKIANKSSMTLATGKKEFYEQNDLSLEDAYVSASQVMVDNMLKHDAEEGIQAFIEKRSAQWLDK